MVGSVVFGIRNLMTDDNWDIIFFVEVIIAFFMYNLCISAHSMLRISYCCKPFRNFVHVNKRVHSVKREENLEHTSFLHVHVLVEAVTT